MNTQRRNTFWFTRFLVLTAVLSCGWWHTQKHYASEKLPATPSFEFVPLAKAVGISTETLSEHGRLFSTQNGEVAYAADEGVYFFAITVAESVSIHQRSWAFAGTAEGLNDFVRELRFVVSRRVAGNSTRIACSTRDVPFLGSEILMRQPWLPSVTGWKPVLHSRDARPPSPARHRIHRRGVAWVERAHRVHYRGGDRRHGINKLLKADELRAHLRRGIRRAKDGLGGDRRAWGIRTEPPARQR